MKKITFILILALLAVTNFTYSQEYVQDITSVTVEAETVAIEVTYDNSYDGSKFYNGIVGYQFTITNVQDTLESLYLEGGYDGTNYVFIDSIAVYVDGTYSLSVANPEFLKYRLYATTAAADTVTLENITYFEKLPKLK